MDDILEKIQVEGINALTSQEKKLLDDKGNYKYSKEGIKKLTKDIEALNDKEFDFVIINVVNPQGLQDFTFLEDWTTGIEFNKQEDIEL